MNILLFRLLAIFPFYSAGPSYTASYICKNTMELMGHKTELKMDVIVITSNVSTIIYYKQRPSNTATLNVQMALPDTSLFENSNWYKMVAGRKIVTGFDTVTITPTSEHKNILGYECQKLKLHYTEGEAECWVCKTLPYTLTPVNGWKPFGGAVLEFDVLSTGMNFTLEEIHKEIKILFT